MIKLSKIKCSRGHENERNQTRCMRCNEDLGYPNVNVYSDDYFKDGLSKRYNQIVLNADASKKEWIEAFEQAIKQDAKVLINMNKSLLFEIVNNNQPYLPYRRAVEDSKRVIAAINNDYRRTVIDASFYGTHGRDIVFATLSLDDDGLGSYGDVSITLDNTLVSDRISVFEKNSFKLYDDLTKNANWNPANFPPPTGHFGIWETQGKLAVAKCHNALKIGNYAKILLKSAENRGKDEFIELHLYGNVTYFAFSKIKLQSQLTNKKDRKNWAILQEKLEEEQIEVVTK